MKHENVHTNLVLECVPPKLLWKLEGSSALLADVGQGLGVDQPVFPQVPALVEDSSAVRADVLRRTVAVFQFRVKSNEMGEEGVSTLQILLAHRTGENLTSLVDLGIVWCLCNCVFKSNAS